MDIRLSDASARFTRRLVTSERITANGKSRDREARLANLFLLLLLPPRPLFLFQRASLKIAAEAASRRSRRRARDRCSKAVHRRSSALDGSREVNIERGRSFGRMYENTVLRL